MDFLAKPTLHSVGSSLKHVCSGCQRVDCVPGSPASLPPRVPSLFLGAGFETHSHADVPAPSRTCPPPRRVTLGLCSSRRAAPPFQHGTRGDPHTVCPAPPGPPSTPKGSWLAGRAPPSRCGERESRFPPQWASPRRTPPAAGEGSRPALPRQHQVFSTCLIPALSLLGKVHLDVILICPPSIINAPRLKCLLAINLPGSGRCVFTHSLRDSLLGTCSSYEFTAGRFSGN